MAPHERSKHSNSTILYKADCLPENDALSVPGHSTILDHQPLKRHSQTHAKCLQLPVSVSNLRGDSLNRDLSVPIYCKTELKAGKSMIVAFDQHDCIASHQPVVGDPYVWNGKNCRYDVEIVNVDVKFQTAELRYLRPFDKHRNEWRSWAELLLPATASESKRRRVSHWSKQ